MTLAPVDQAKADAQLIKDLDALFERAKRDREPYERQWWVNMAFYLGEHHAVWNPVSKKLSRPRVPKWRVLMAVNLITGTIRTEYAKLIQQRPMAKAQPNSDDPDDENQARVMDDLLDYLWTADGSDKASKRALLWALITGTGLFEAYWDKTAGEPLMQPETTFDVVSGTEVPNPAAGQPVTDENGDTVHMGEIRVNECSPFEFYPDPFGLDMAQKNWCFNVKLRSPEYVHEQYGVEVKASEFKAEDHFDGQVATITGAEAQPREGVLVKRFYQRSTKKHPEGRYVVYVNDKVLYQGANPYPKAQLPYSSFVHIPVPGRFWGDSIITHLLDPQRNLNKSRAQTVELRNLMAKGKWTYARGALRPGQTITSAPGEMIPYDVVPNAPDGGRPKMEQGLAIPDSFWKDIEQAKEEINQVSGVNEVSRADTPAGVTSGRAIAFLQEQDDTRLGPTSQGYEEAIADISRIKLALAKQFYDEPRTIRVVGSDSTVRVREFYKEDIPDDVDVKVQAGSSLPKSRVARQEFVLTLHDKGIVPDPKDVAKLLEFGEVEGLYEDLNRDIGQAERENERMKNAEPSPDGTFPPAVLDFHNHEVHIREHNKWRKGEEHERLAPELQAAFAEHVEAHKLALMQQAEIAAAMGQPAPGTVRAAVTEQQLPEPEAPPELVTAA